MIRNIRFALILGTSIALMPMVGLAQSQVTPTAQPDGQSGAGASAVPAEATVPLDQQPSKEQLAKLFEVMRVNQQMASVSKMMPALIQQQFDAQMKQMAKDLPERGSMTEEQRQASAKVMGRYIGKAMMLYTSDEMISDMSAIYAKHLSRTDVDGIIAFYSSPAGEHMLDMVPVIMKEIMPLVMTRMQERIKPLTEEMAKEMAEIAKTSRHPQSAPIPK